MTNEAAERLLALIQAEHGYDFTESVKEALTAERKPLLAALRALVEDPDSPATSDWLLDCEQGRCCWCGTFLNSGDGHNDGCAFQQARAILDAEAPAIAHSHEWHKEYAPNYRQASEADDFRWVCDCGEIRTGT